MSTPKKICIIGSGNWGSVIARITGQNVKNLTEFNTEIKMYVYEEIINGRKLTEIINTEHENVKYLPGYKLPENIVAVSSVVDTCRGADVLIFVLPHQFINGICQQMKGVIKPNAFGVSLIKGFDESEKGVDLLTNKIRRELKIQCAVLMGANIAGDIASENFSEATIGCKDKKMGALLKKLFQTPYFRIVVVEDEETVELCGALKNIVALGTGFVDGLGYLDNTRAAVIRLGIMEMVTLAKLLYPSSKIETFLESCGIADVVATSYGGRNAKVAKAFVESNKTIEQVEAEMLNGQKLQGPATAKEVNALLKSKGLEAKFPLFTAIHKICARELPPKEFMVCLANHPEHM